MDTIWAYTIFKLIIINSQIKVQLGVSDDGKMKHDAYVVDTKVDACKIASGFIGQYFVRDIIQKIERFSNLTINCPVKKVKIVFISVFENVLKLK